MKRSRCFGLALMLAATGCAAAGPDTALSWEEFESQAYQEPDTGVYIVNGDETAETADLLRDAYTRYLDTWEESRSDVGALGRGLIVNLVNGKDDKWSASAAQSLTYCVSKSSFGSRYSAVVTAMEHATAAWEAAARVTFVHDTAADASCSKRTGVVFDVRQVCTGRYLARSFFPSTSRSGREILVDCTSFGNIKPWTLDGVLRHELGHTIGFRHEHTRPEAGTCFEDNNWRALTKYDSASVMHYPQCNGSNNGDLVLTSLDKLGAGLLYP